MNLTTDELKMPPACTCQPHWASSWWNGPFARHKKNMTMTQHYSS